MEKRYFSRIITAFVGLACFFIFLTCNRAYTQIPELQTSENFKLVRLHYANSSGEKGITNYDYDVFGQLRFSRWQEADGMKNSLNRYTLNEKGDIVEKYRIFNDTLYSRQTYAYDLCGKIQQETFMRSDGTTGRVKYRYDDHGRLSSAECQRMNGWFNGKILYSYNSYDVLVEALIRRDGKDIGQIKYQYDINGNLIHENWDFNGNWEQSLVYEYVEAPEIEFVSANPFVLHQKYYRLEEEYYVYSDEMQGPSSFEYKEGRLIRKIYTRSDGLKTETEYQYDLIGNLIRASRQYSNGQTAEIEYSFNDMGRMQRKWLRRSDGLESDEVYQYDAEGRLIMARIKNMDAWLSGTIAFSHNVDGQPVKGFFKGDDGFDADIYFEYDDYMNLIGVHWDFSTGKQQTYTYRYKTVYKEDGVLPESVQ